jgi:dolichyl-phosphate-mannose-protein mannosyltransferase
LTLQGRRAAIAGVVAGVAYTLSPFAALFAALAVLLFWWALRGLDGIERRRVCGLLLAATLLRAAAIVVLLLTTTPAQHFKAYFPDALFAIARSWWILNIWQGVTIGPLYELSTYNPYGATSYSYVLGALQMIVGRSPYGLNFVSLTAFLAGAIALYRMARESFGPSAALIGLGVLLFWPTMFAWSVSMLKEPMQFGLSALLIVFTLRAVRSRAWKACAIGALLAVATGYAMTTLRSAAPLVAIAGVTIGVAGWLLTRRQWVAAVTLAACLVGGAVAARDATVQQQMLDLARTSADRQVGYWASTGFGYKTLDQRFYSEGARATRGMLPDEAARYLGRAVIAFFTVPWPWQMESRAALVSLPQQIAWYGLVLLVLPGFVSGFRRDPLVAWILISLIAAGVVVIAPNSGNIGTLVRHRDIVVPPVALLGSAGFVSILGVLVNPGRRWAGRRPAATA